MMRPLPAGKKASRTTVPTKAVDAKTQVPKPAPLKTLKADQENANAKPIVDQTEVPSVAAPFCGEGVWTCPMPKLLEALSAAKEAKMTPLLIDATGDNGDFTPLETYFSYSGHALLEMKKMVVEVNMRKQVPLEEAMEAARDKLILAMRRGLDLVILLSNSAPPLRSKFSSPTQLPCMLLEDNAAVQSALGTDVDINKIEWTKTLLRDGDKLPFVHKDFSVVVITKFEEEDYVDFLRDELPLDAMQHIKVVQTEH